MSFDKSGMYLKVSVANFDNQKFQSRAQKYALIVHAYICLAVMFVMSPLFKAFHYLRDKYNSENGIFPPEYHHYMDYAIENETKARMFRPFGASTLSKIHAALSRVWNLLATPFRYIGDVLSNTDSLKLKPQDELKMAQTYFENSK